MYQVGEKVVYGSSGVCEVTNASEMDFSRDGRVYYALTPIGTTSCVYVPLDSELLMARMRPLYSREALTELLCKASGEEMPWIDNAHLRGQAFQQVLLSADPAAILRLITALRHREAFLATRGKKNLMADEATLKKAERILYGEIACVMGLAGEEIPLFLGGLTKEA